MPYFRQLLGITVLNHEPNRNTTRNLIISIVTGVTEDFHKSWIQYIMKTNRMLKQHKPLAGRDPERLKKSWKDQRRVESVGK
jgi:hypothetical protein